MFRSYSENVGAKTKFNMGQKATKKTDWLEVHRKWKQWNRFHSLQSTSQGEDRDLSSPFCSPLYAVLQFAKNSEIQDPSPLRQLMCEQEKRAALRLFALKYQGKLYELLQGTPYQRFIWGNQSHSLKQSSLERVEVCGELLVNKINERSKKLVRQLMSYIVTQADHMRHYQDVLEKHLKRHDSRSSHGAGSGGSSRSSRHHQ